MFNSTTLAYIEISTKTQQIVAFVLFFLVLMTKQSIENEPRHEKTGFLHMRKQRRRAASR